MKSKNLKIWIRVILFFLLFAILAGGLSRMCIPHDELCRKSISAFYQEPKNSLDVVYIGSSNCLTFWNPLVGWQEYGVVVYPYAGSSVPFYAAEYMIREVRKTQPNAKFVVNINTLPDGPLKVRNMHKSVDFMPLSFNRISLANHLADMVDWKFGKRLELYFPYTRYHVRWEEQLEPAELDGMKGAMSFLSYMQVTEDISEDYEVNDEKITLEPEAYASTDSLLEYCKKENIDVLFAVVPQANRHGVKERVNELADYLGKKGFPVLDMMDKTQEMGLDLSEDFYNARHTNIHGSIKFTHFLAQYLIDAFQLPDRREQKEYESWNTALEKYRKEADRHVMPFEWDPVNRDFSLPAPAKLHASTHKGRAMLTWKPVKGAEFYSVYRRLDGGWELLQTVRSRSFYDPQMEVGGRYQYRVVPCVTREGRTLYGNFQYDGPFVRAR